MTPADISVVIPAIDEEAVIATAVRSAFQAGATEVIVVDGGSADKTCKVATEAGASKIVRSLPGRGIQMNSGAFVAERDWLLFLHADNQLDEQSLNQICEHPDYTWGAFRQCIDSPQKIFRVIEWGNALRAKYRGVPFGDQAIFVRRSVFKKQGGFAEVSLMEDVDLSKRLRKIAPPLLLEGPLTISPRRWQQHGVVRQTLRNWCIQLSYALGASPESLKRWYR
jgi:rSAM/selenodomain-associated transferase 2